MFFIFVLNDPKIRQPYFSVKQYFKNKALFLWLIWYISKKVCAFILTVRYRPLK
jgi:hypothetical protein